MRTVRFISAFTLVELSVVLVIIGLLLGAVVGGQTLIKNAELQAIMSDKAKYKEAVTTFKKQYNALPGDMPDAVDFWGSAVSNGDGSKALDYTSAAPTVAEAYLFWRELALAGRIVGNYTGSEGSGSAQHSIPDINIPSARAVNSGWDVGSGSVSASIPDTKFAIADYGNFLRVGRASASQQVTGVLLTPEEAWKIDSKLDDGNPGRGSIISSHPVLSATSCATASTVSDLDKPYNLTVKTAACTLFFIQQF